MTQVTGEGTTTSSPGERMTVSIVLLGSRAHRATWPRHRFGGRRFATLMVRRADSVNPVLRSTVRMKSVLPSI